jgi:hypothetical protein
MPTPNDYSDFRFGKDQSATRQEGNFGTGGDYGQTSNAPTSNVAADTYPNAEGYGFDASNPQFSGDKSATPDAMASETAGSQNAFAELQHYFNNSPYTPGARVCHELKEVWTPPHPEASGPGDGKTGPDGRGE